MDISITTTQENKLLSRTEVKARIAFDGSIPSRKNLRKELATKLKAKEDHVIIKKIQPLYGEMAAQVSLWVFDSDESLKSITSKSLLKRHGLLEEKKEEAK